MVDGFEFNGREEVLEWVDFGTGNGLVAGEEDAIV